MSEKSERRNNDRFHWIMELVIFTTLVPSVVYVMLDSLPVV